MKLKDCDDEAERTVLHAQLAALDGYPEDAIMMVSTFDAEHPTSFDGDEMSLMVRYNEEMQDEADAADVRAATAEQRADERVRAAEQRADAAIEAAEAVPRCDYCNRSGPLLHRLIFPC